MFKKGGAKGPPPKGGSSSSCTPAAGKGGHPGKGGHASRYGDVPKSLQNRAKYRRRRCSSAPNLKVYGPRKKKDNWLLLLSVLKFRYPDLVRDMEEKEKEKEKDDERVRISEKEAEQLPQLTVKKVNFHVQGRKAVGNKPAVPGNSALHHTNLYFRCQGDNPRPVFRRGQEFKMTLTFDREYDVKQDDLVLEVQADDDSPGKNLQASFRLDEERKEPFPGLSYWAARIIRHLPGTNAIKLAVYIPGKCPVGDWDLKVKTILGDQVMKCVYEHDVSFAVLFNPWSKQDMVYFPEQKDLEEYVLSDESLAYFGSSRWIRSKPWRYGQFDEKILEVCFTILKQGFGGKMTSAMGNPILVARALSKMVNSQDDAGVLVGNWSGNYDGGCSPTKWMSSANILRQYHDEGEPVKFGQCWVFSHVLTAMCRCLGIPCRSMTNFDSAHDTDGSCSIDCYYNKDGTENKYMKKDSIWNFHVWNDAWINRPDIEEIDCSGWHAVDATPQEASDGCYQCGPSPLAAIKRGLIHLGYDTAFIFAECNADVVHWGQEDDGEWKPTNCKKRSVGCGMSTKMPHCDDRLDVTDQYKFPEDTDEERCAVKRAVRLTGGQDIYIESANIDVSFDENPHAQLGQELVATVIVENTSSEERTVNLLMSARSCSYFNDSDDDKELFQETKNSIKIKAGAKLKVPFKVGPDKYIDGETCAQCVYVYVRCTDQATNMPYSAQEPFELCAPDLCLMENNVKSKPGQVMTVKVTFTNPMDIPLTNCEMLMDGALLPGGKDKDAYRNIFGMWAKDLGRTVGKREKVVLEFNIYWEAEKEDKDDDEDDDDGHERCTATEEDDGAPPPPPQPAKKTTKKQKLEFYCSQMDSMTVTFTTICVRP